MRLDWKAVVGVAVTVLLLWWLLRDVDLARVWLQVRQGDPWLLLAAVAVATFGFVIRAFRWKVLLAPLEPDTGLHNRFAAVSVGFMANNVLPARMGEFARAYALSRVEPVSASAAFGTLVVERVLDGLTLLAILLVTLSWPTFPGENMLEGTRIGAAVDGVVVVVGAILVGMIVLLLRPEPFVRWTERLASYLPGDFARPIVGALEAFLDSLAILRRPGLLLQAILWSVGFWLWHGYSFYLGMLAFGIRPEDPFVAALFTEAIVAFGVAAPSAPGFFGTFHWAADFALSGVYGVEEARSLAFALAYHLAGWIPVTAIGLWYAWKLGLSLADVGRSEARVEAEVEAEHPEAAAWMGSRSAPARDREAPTGAVAVRAPAKVNLVLRILERDRESGYHDLETVFQAIGLCDELRVEVADDPAVRLEVEGADVGPERENLVWRAATAFLDEASLERGLRIHLRKRIPAGAGLGGGSSDAASTLRALDFLFDAPLGRDRLAAIAASLGSDVSFFLGDEGTALAWGRGERLRALPPLATRPIVVVVPDEPISTAAAYGELAAARDAGASLPARARADGRSDGSGALRLRDLDRLTWSDVEALAANDFEAVLFERRPRLARLRDAVDATGPRIALLSGSGSALFAVYDDEPSADGAAEALRAEAGVREVVRTSTLERIPLPHHVALDRRG